MIKKIKGIFEERKYQKKYNSLKVVYDTEMVEKQNLIEENEFLRKQVRRLTKERSMLRGRVEQKLSNDKRSTKNSRNRVSVS